METPKHGSRFYSGKGMDLEGSVNDLDKSRCKRQRRTSEQANLLALLESPIRKYKEFKETPQRSTERIQLRCANSRLDSRENICTRPSCISRISNAGSREKLTNVQHHVPQNCEIYSIQCLQFVYHKSVIMIGIRAGMLSKIPKYDFSLG